MNSLEKSIAKEYDMQNAYFTGNGTTALYLIFKALNMQDKKILFPDITCMTPVNAAIYAGYDVTFCDVSKENFTIDIESLKEVIKNETIGVVVATHIYGHLCDMQEIYRICSERNIVVIEDAAQTFYISKYNNFAITSFGHTKLFESSKGGGAIFYKNKELKEEFDKYSLGMSDKNNKEEFREYTSEYYRITKELKGEDYYVQMRQLQLSSKNIFLKHFKENDEILELFKRKEDIILQRNNRVNLYKKYLDNEKFIYPSIDNIDKTTLWRLSILTKDINRNKLVDMVRENNVDISTWYPCLHRFYSKRNDQEFCNAVELEKNVVNFWVTEKYSEEKIKEDIDKINSIIKREFS